MKVDAYGAGHRSAPGEGRVTARGEVGVQLASAPRIAVARCERALATRERIVPAGHSHRGGLLVRQPEDLSEHKGVTPVAAEGLEQVSVFDPDQIERRGSRGGDRREIGHGSFRTTDGALVVGKDYKVLVIDVSGLPASVGKSGTDRASIAVDVAAQIMSC